MRAICLVHKVEFEFAGNVAKGAITLGDVDNDGHNELVIGNDKGEVGIFKVLKPFSQSLHKINPIKLTGIRKVTNSL